MTKKDETPLVEEGEEGKAAASPPTEAVEAEPSDEVSAAAAQGSVSVPAHTEPEASTGTGAPPIDTDVGTTAPNFASSSTSAPYMGSGGAGTTAPGGSSYPPLPPRQPKKSVASRVFSWPALVFLLVVIIIILFIWGITANQSSTSVAKPAPQPAQKTLAVEPIAAPGMATAQPAPKLSSDQQQELMSARAAYWHHDIPSAISKYENLIKEVPDAAFAYGELGNVYYMDGQRDKAADNFEHAAMLLIQQGQVQQAASLIPVLGALDPALAQRVQVALSHSPEDDGYGASNTPQ
ncbi:tetratricopeptide repeat protein [Acidithiobacillus sp. IBUN Pt1247-S3]|uniref:tetratricopeptide repeat protein n=1 Tax=Acidithiobacillus sp. IBUN Pt1247-S3 TaxID=3166642 RepID=UPI0034E3F2D7